MRQRLCALAAAALLCACAQARPPAGAVRPAIEDMEPDVRQQVQAILSQLAQGQLAPETLTERARAALPAPRLQEIRQTLQSCSAIGPLELLDRQTKGEDRMYVYRAPCGGKPLLVEIDFGKGSRIGRLAVKAQ